MWATARPRIKAGSTAWLSASPFRLARATDAPIVSYWTLREPDGIRNAIRVEPPLSLPEMKSEDDYQAALQQAVDRHERYLREYPDHWFQIDTPASWANLDGIWASPPSP